MSKSLVFGPDAREKILKGVNIIAKAVGSSYGPSGKLSIYRKPNGELHITRDGISIAKNCLPLKDEFENYGAELVKKASSSTCDSSGDGTSLTAIYCSALINEGVRMIAADHSFVDIKEGIDFAVQKVVERLQQMAKPINDIDTAKNIATISANNDSTIGELIAKALDTVGNSGIVSLHKSNGLKTELIVTNGYNFDRGFISPHFINNDKSECVLEDPLILIAERGINNVNILLPILQEINEKYKGRPLLVIAETVEGEALATLAVNVVRQLFKSCAVKSPGFGDRRKDNLIDLCSLTGAALVSEDLGRKLENFDINWLGKAKKVVITKGSTTIIEGAGSETDIGHRVSELRHLIEIANDNYDKEKLEERLAKLVGGCAQLLIGGQTEQEIAEKFDRAEDSLNATKSAIEQGYVAGGALALFKAAKVLDEIEVPERLRIGVKIVRKVSEEPMRKIIENAGCDFANVRLEVNNSKSDTYGFDARSKKFCDLVEAGIIDPLKVIRSALENSASIAGLILTTECMIMEEKVETKK